MIAMNINCRRVVVTGIGAIACNGSNRDELFNNCAEGKNGMNICSLFDASKLKTAYVGQIRDDSMPYLTEKQSDSERIQFLVERALNEAMEDSGITQEDINALGCRGFLSFATSLAANGRIMGYVREKSISGSSDAEWLVRIPAFISWMKEKCGINGGCYTIMSACAAGSTATGIAFDIIQENKADIVIVGGADPLTEFSCIGFHVLKSLSSSLCKPFDVTRDGINIGEGSAFFVVESLEHARSRNAKIYGEIMGYGLNNDAYHITSPDPDGYGAYESMLGALGSIDPSEVDYINAHGTGTTLNDYMETMAIGRLFEKKNLNVSISSTKSMIGHCLAAAGAIEMAVTLMAIKNGVILPTIRISEEMETCEGFDYAKEKKQRNIKYALSNSYAFAGNTASLLIGAYDGRD